MTKLCRHCKTKKSSDQFYKQKTTSDGLQCYCKDCHRILNRDSERKAWSKRKVQRSTRREALNAHAKEWQKKWAIKNPDLYQKRLDRIQEWNKKNPEKYLERKRRIESRRRTRFVGSHTTQEWQSVIDKYQKCLMCGKPGDINSLERDHIVPVSVGGTNNIDNLQPLCRSCNSCKGSKTIDLRN